MNNNPEFASIKKEISEILINQLIGVASYGKQESN